jgi:hypothetical protein
MSETVQVHFPSEVPLRHKAEIVVIGGGPGGIGAAVAAAREKRDVLLVEHYGFLGGMATAGEVHPFMTNALGQERLDQGLFTEWLERINRLGGGMPKSPAKIGNDGFDPNVARLAAEELCLEAGVRLLFHHRPVLVEKDGRRISTVVLHSKSGLTGVQADVFIDSTGDGDLAAMAGCAFEYGGESGPDAQPMTLCFKVRVEPNDLPEEFRAQGPAAWLWKNRASVQAAFERAKKAGLYVPRQNVLMFSCTDKYVVHFNSTRVMKKSGINGEELSAAEIEGRKQLRDLTAFLKAEIPIFKNLRLHSIAVQIGVRETRRIRGRAYLTRNDYARGAVFPDGIVRCRYPIDIHNPNGEGTEITRLPDDAWYEVPYGCLVPADADNLLIGGRCISVDHAVHSSIRVMPPVCSLGQAAGTAAAMALEQKTDPSKIDGTGLKERLIRNGRNLLRHPPEFKQTVPEQTSV